MSSKATGAGNASIAAGPEAPPFGAYAPNRAQQAIIRLTRAIPDSWLGRRTAFALRKLVVNTLRRPLDVDVFGQKMRLWPFNNVTEKRILFTPQFFDAEERAFLAGVAHDGFVFLDVGANIGAYTVFVAGLGLNGARLVAIEPLPELFARLTYNISLNGQPVKAIACALSDKDGEMALFVHQGNQGQSSLKVVGWEHGHGETLTVPTMTLARLLKEERLDHVDAVKLDAEGSEDLILVPFFADAPEALWPRYIILERSPSRWRVDCIGLCRENGYEEVLRTRMNVVLERQPEKGSRRDTAMPDGATSQT